MLTQDLERPIRLVWQDASISQAAMPEAFEKLVDVLRDVEREDIEAGRTERFQLVLA